MKFLYIDESGNSSDNPYLVFFALQIDAYKLKKSMRDARPLLERVASAYPEDLPELKTSRLVNGKGAWRRVEPEVRKSLFLDLCGYLEQVGASAFCYLLSHDNYRTHKANASLPPWAQTAWLAGATALTMLVQRENCKAKNNKGLSILIFDDNRAELPQLSEFLLRSSPDVDLYCERAKKAEPFDHIIDTAFAIKSEHSRLVQISDACAYALRRKAELHLAGQGEAWSGERALMDTAVNKFSARLKFPTKTWVSRPMCPVAVWIRDAGVTNLNDWVHA